MTFDDMYYVNEHGVVVQRESSHNPIEYNQKYMDDRYAKVPLDLSYIRLAHLFTVLEVNDKFIPGSLLDVGSGLGQFVRVASRGFSEVYHYDIFQCDFVWSTRIDYDELSTNHFDVVCFFDSLEHMEDPIGFIDNLDCDYICISVPWCHYHTEGQDWFMKWKHRRVNEHFYNYDVHSLTLTMADLGYIRLSKSSIEDIVRPSDTNLPNILTCIFRKDTING